MDESTLLEASESASRLLEREALEVRRRRPLLDEDCLEVADVDLVAVWDRQDELPERRTVEGPGGRVFVDILWIPASALLDPVEGAAYMMLPHLLAESERVWSRSEVIGSMAENVVTAMHESRVWGRRLGEQVKFGDAALREAARNLDFPPAAVFFLQTAHAYYLTAVADSLKQSVMSLLTRPMSRARRISAETGVDLERMMRTHLGLGADPSAGLEALGRVHAAASARSSPRQEGRLGGRVRGHYLYSLSPLELEYREKVARALVRRGDFANANFYLRFWAYSLARCPVILEEAREGRETSFYVPFRPFKESVQAACPEILDDVGTIFGADVTRADAVESIRGTEAFRELAAVLIKANGLGPSRPWKPMHL